MFPACSLSFASSLQILGTPRSPSPPHRRRRTHAHPRLSAGVLGSASRYYAWRLPADMVAVLGVALVVTELLSSSEVVAVT